MVAKDGLNLLPKAANRLIGRLLFISYLIDRDVTFNDQNYITGKNKIERKSTFRNLITNKNQLYNFFEYLTNKYNGDMFPLIEKDKEIIYKEEDYVTPKHLKVLSYLFNCSEFFAGNKKFNSNYAVQKSLFDLYDFEIIPVELISSIYENFIGNSEENENLNLSKQKDIKAYYTPSYLVIKLTGNLHRYKLNCKDYKCIQEYQYIFRSTHARAQNVLPINIFHIILNYNHLVVA